jgi:GNAT superfamily N-acetyltransferase
MRRGIPAIMNYEVVKYTPEFKDRVAKLREHLQSPDASLNAEYLDWKYGRNPYVASRLIYVGLHRGQVVGMRGLWGAKWQIGRPCQSFAAPCAGDLVIDPAHRNQGLFTTIMEAALKDLAPQGYQYIFNLSAGPATYFGSLMAGWRSAGLLQTAHRRSGEGTIHRRWHRYISRRLPFLPSTETRDPFGSLDENGAQRRGEAGTNVDIEQTPRPQAMAELVERIGNDGRIRHVRDRQYFAWRFQNPLSRYRFLFWQGARLEGYLVLRTSVYQHRYREGVSIVDWEAANPQVQADLLHAAVLWGDFDKLTIWSASLPAETKRVLQSAGFDFSGEAKSLGRSYRAGTDRTGILVRPVREEMLAETDWILGDRRLLDLGDWNLRMIYSDSF